MSNYYLRVEAVNLDISILDTYNISTIRGGSFMLFEAIKALEENSYVSTSLTKISEGASTGLYQLANIVSDEAAKKIKENVLAVLHDKAPTATFVADYYNFDCEECSGDFSKGVKMLIAKNRWSQWRNPTVVLPAVNNAADKACTLDGVRPGLHTDGDEKVSDATWQRLKFGRKLRKELYKTILKDDNIKVEFTKDLEALSNDPQQGNLNGKIAFIYVDGNKFGRIRDKYCKSGALLKRFDKVVQEDLRATILRNILEEAKKLDDFKTVDGELRLETLLWGGDEIEWVVPAWLGWKILEIFYSTNKVYEVEREDQHPEAIPLTHACGIVFCNHSAPILQIRKIAHSIVEKVKETLNGIPKTNNAGNLIQYLVLESFDMLEGSLESFTDNYYKTVGFSELMINGGDIPTLKKCFGLLHTYFPRNKVFEIVAALKSTDQDIETIGKNIEEIKKKALTGMDADQEKVKDAIDNITKSNPNRWYLIADMWEFFKETK